MRFIWLFILNRVFAAQFSIPAKAQTPPTDATFSTARNYCISLVLLFVLSVSNAALASTGCSTWNAFGTSMSAGRTVANSIGGFAEGDIITINFNNGNTNNVVKITALGSMSVVQWVGGTTTTVSYTVTASDVGSNISYELFGGANNNWSAEFECVSVSSVAVPSAGSYAVGDTLNFTIVTSENVTVDTSSGTPQLSLTIGTTIVQANYVSGSGTKNLSFAYIVQAGESDLDGISVGTLTSNGGSLIKTGARYPSSMGLTLDNIGSTSSVFVDTTAPALTFSPADSGTGVAADANITITFSEAVRLLDDSALSDTNVDALITLKDTNSSGSDIAFDATISGNVITINPTGDFSSEQTVYVAIGATVEDSADNAITASNATFTVVQTNSPALDFAANDTAIRTVLVDDMMRAVRSSLNASARMMSDVGGRLRGADGSVSTLSTRSVPLEIDGVASADAGTLTTRGTATASLIRHNGAYSRLFFSDFNIQHDLDTDNTTATLSARVAWERIVADGTLLGYYAGAEASESDIHGTFAGDQTRLGLNVGGYVAHRLADTLYMDAYVSLGVGHSELDMSNGTLALESDYRSETVTTGAALSGVYEYDAYEFRPEIAFNYGKTELGQVCFTGRAYGLVDDTLTLNAGSVSVANLTLRPEVRMDIDEVSVLPGAGILSFSPRFICERTMSTRRTQNCGGGAEVGYAFQSKDGLRNIELNIAMDEVGSARRTSAVVGVEMRF